MCTLCDSRSYILAAISLFKPAVVCLRGESNQCTRLAGVGVKLPFSPFPAPLPRSLQDFHFLSWNGVLTCFLVAILSDECTYLHKACDVYLSAVFQFCRKFQGILLSISFRPKMTPCSATRALIWLLLYIPATNVRAQVTTCTSPYSEQQVRGFLKLKPLLLSREMILTVVCYADACQK